MSGSGGTSKSKPKDVIAPEFQELRSPFADQTAGLIPAFEGLTAETPTLGAGLNPEDFAEPITPQEQALVDQIFLGGVEPSQEQLAAEDLRTRTIEGEFLEPDSVLFDALARPVTRAFEEARRGDVGAFTRAGQNIQESSPFFRARSIAQEGLAGQLANIGGQLVLNERQLQAQAAREAEAQDAQRLQTARARLEATALPRLVRDLGVERGLAAFELRLNTLLNLYNTVAGITDEAIGQRSTSTQAGVGLA